uniref:Cathepsin K n=1 Tax=Caligus clemensi TaxID=344056 RepID=C1C1K1_CALCM|nr:Cathepsin K precursor [Caligus clemensi]
MNKLLFIPLGILILLSGCSSLEFSPYEIQRFEEFQKTFGKVYDDRMTYSKRLRIFIHNLRVINAHNANPGRSYDLAVNKFTDLTEKEFTQRFLGYQKVPGVSKNRRLSSKGNATSMENLPEEVDWRKKGAVGIMRWQGLICGSCWAVSSTGIIESHVFINEGILPTLSIQQVTSCALNPYSCGGKGGCDGSISQVAFMYAQLYGLTSEEEYPYISGMTNQTETCKFNFTDSVALARVRGYETLPSNDMEAVMRHLAEVGPLSVNVDSTLWHSYGGGVMDGFDFDKNINLNHIVQLIGYGLDEKQGPYWLIKNSWGSDWGEEGFIRIKRYSETQCGFDATPLNGTGCVNDGNDVQHVCGNFGVLFDSSYPLGATIHYQ